MGYPNIVILSFLLINIAPITIQTVTVEIKDIESLSTSSLDRLLGSIDPTLDKFRYTTIEIVSFIEDRIKINIEKTLLWLETNLFVLLFAIIVLFIFIFILLNLLDILLVRYEYLPAERRFIGLIVVTIIFFWLFIVMILSIWPGMNNIDLQTLKYVLVGLLCSVIVYFIHVWICYLYIHRCHILDYLKLLFGCNTTNRILTCQTLEKETTKI
jgi:hypothetical protein